MKSVKPDKPVANAANNQTAGPRPARPTLTSLKKTWWWRKRDVLRLLPTRFDWPAVEVAARNYELMRRSPQGRQFVKTYIELGPDVWTLVHRLWCTWKTPVLRIAWRREDYEEIGWTPVNEHQHMQWNLRAADKHLIDEFIREIRLLREIQKIEPPSHPLKGKKYRGVSWRLVEILDEKESGAKLNDSDRHTLSRAQRSAGTYFVDYTAALEKWNAKPHPFADLIAEEQAEDDPF
jgi:hypothetical protein